jgi:hypothetical protein
MLIRKLEGERTCGNFKCEREDNKYYNDSQRNSVAGCEQDLIGP